MLQASRAVEWVTTHIFPHIFQFFSTYFQSCVSKPHCMRGHCTSAVHSPGPTSSCGTIIPTIADNQPPSGRCHFRRGFYTLVYMGGSQVNTDRIWRHQTNRMYTKVHCERVCDWLLSGRWIKVPLLELNCYIGYGI